MSVLEIIWQKNYNLNALTVRRWKILIYRLVVLLILLAALVCLGFFLQSIIAVVGYISWQIILPPATGAKFFWAAILLFCYVWYRIDRENTWYPVLPASASLIEVDKYLSEGCWRVMEKAYRYAGKLKHSQVEPIHFLAGALEDSTTGRVLGRLGLDNVKFVSVLKKVLNDCPTAGSKAVGLSADSLKVWQAATTLALTRHSRRIEVTELLVALSQSESNIRDVWEEMSVTTQSIINITAWFSLRRRLRLLRQRQLKLAGLRPKKSLDRAYLAVATPLLNYLGRDLTYLAAQGYLAPCVGREKEVEEIYRLIEGGSHSVVLTGDPGVGKTSLLEGLAQAMAADEVPPILRDKRLVTLSLPQLLGNTSADQAAQRLWQALMEAVHAGNIVLVVENIGQLLGSTSQGSEAVSLADMMANAITKYGLLVVATIGQTDWNNNFEDSALGQVLQKIEVNEQEDDEAIQVLESYVPRLENKHQVYFSYGALETAVKLTKRYLPDRRLPEKAMSLCDETAVFIREQRGKKSIIKGEDIASLLAGKIHVPLTQVTEQESAKLINLEEILHRKIIGQDEAVRLVAEALRRARVNLRDDKKPVASFLFLGPTGVGKTELAKVVTGEYFGSDKEMVRLDMSEYQASDSIHLLLGAPQGKKGEGYLTESIRRNPYCLLLLDELEKAHPDVLNIFLQILDEGRVKDANGRLVDFSNAIIIATSNAGTEFIQDSLGAGQSLAEIREQLVRQKLKDYFRPEFLNRFDAIVVFKPLSLEEIEKVTVLLLNKLAKQLEVKNIRLKATPEAIKELAKKGFDPLYGARPLKRAIQDNVDSALAKYLLTGKLRRRDVVVLEPGGVVRVEKGVEL
ncbi:ATP-dependent Clp protease ATP-binding subunit [Patescibacteria group bacterium]|nr:ATP-dependent Clp protease ATP-binding subunit [Patescibacteria group bacterium]